MKLPKEAMAMSKAKKRRAAPFSPWSDFDPPEDLPDDLKAVYNLAAAPVLIATSFCSFPERFDSPPEWLSSWFGPLRQAYDELAGWLRTHEAKLRAEAPDVLTALQRVFGVVEPLRLRLGALIGMLEANPVDPNDAQLVALVQALRENSVKNQSRLAHALLDGISVTENSLTELRSALSGWANRREVETMNTAACSPADSPVRRRKRHRGRPADTDPVADMRITEAWATGSYRTHEELGRDLRKSKREVKMALDRHRKRQNVLG